MYPIYTIPVHTVAHCLHPCSSQVGNACMPRRSRLGYGGLPGGLAGDNRALYRKEGRSGTPPKCSSAPPGCGRVGRARWPGAVTVAPCSQKRRRRRARKIRVTLRLDLLPFIRHHHQTLCCPRCSSAGPSEQLRPLHTVGFSQFFRPKWHCLDNICIWSSTWLI